ncbi:MAG: hypothetical protein ACJATI_005074 [Halioglobus sp.]|jgi:hypothetical protein
MYHSLELKRELNLFGCEFFSEKKNTITITIPKVSQLLSY